ncbi:hypothetical protein BC332_31003 [Capsicum chinense]|nr:hypothetical protein BC332_31003 [Capsicum chinense]
MKAQALVDHLAENPIDEDYVLLKTYFPDEEVFCVEKVIIEADPGWKLFFDGAVNMKEVRIGAVLISKLGQYFPVTAQLRFYCTNNMVEHEACILSLRLAVDMRVQELLVLGDSDLLVHQIQVKFRHILRIHNEIADALATLSSMLQHPNKAYIDPVYIHSRDQYAYCNAVEEELDGEPWFFDIKRYIQSEEYPTHATIDQKRTIRRLASGFFLTWGIDVIGSIELKVSNGHRFILVTIDYFTKWVEAVTFKSANGAVEAANKNIKKILQKMVQGSRQWHEKLSFALLGYRTTVRTSTGATPYLLMYGTETVIPTEVEIPSLRVIMEVDIDDDEREWLERITKRYDPGILKLVLKRILPHQVEAKGKFSPNWQGPFIVKKVLPNGSLYLTAIKGKMAEMAINAGVVKRYYDPPGKWDFTFRSGSSLKMGFYFQNLQENGILLSVQDPWDLTFCSGPS